MSEIKTGGPAFPTIGNVAHNPDWITEEGMTLRDYFAAMALQGMATSVGFQGGPWDKLAKDAYDASDAMLKARKHTRVVEL